MQHINIETPGAICYCLCGYSYSTGGELESLNVVWLNDDGSVDVNCFFKNTKEPDCVECLARFPLYLLAETELE